MVATSVMNVRETWETYKQGGDPGLREALVEHYYPIVRLHAQRIRAKLPGSVELDDLISAGVFGLMEAIESYDLERGVKFDAYCTPRIRGAIMDELRSMDWVPRLARTRSSRIEHAASALRNELGCPPGDDEIMERLDVDDEEYRDLCRDARTLTMVSLHRPVSESETEDGSETGALPDPVSVDPVDEAERRELRAALASHLTRTEQLVVTLYYYEELTMREIGAVLDVSESRVSQMLTAIRDRLKGVLRGIEPEC